MSLDNAKRLGGAVLAVGLIAGGSLLAGCNGAGSFCTLARQCEGGNDADQKACAIVQDEQERIADLHNCDTEYDDYVNCVYDNARCNNNVYAPDAKLCASQSDRYAKCIQ